jgi:hypothetical protein
MLGKEVQRLGALPCPLRQVLCQRLGERVEGNLHSRIGQEILAVLCFEHVGVVINVVYEED